MFSVYFWKDCGAKENALGNQNAWFRTKGAATYQMYAPKKKKQISPFGFFIYYIKKSDMISKIQFLNSIFLKFFWDFIFYIDEADDSVLLVYCI